MLFFFFFFFQAEDGIRDYKVTGVQTCALPILSRCTHARGASHTRSPCSSPTTRDNSNSRKAPKSAHETQSQPARVLLFSLAGEIIGANRNSGKATCATLPLPVKWPLSLRASFASSRNNCGVFLHASALR